MSSYRFGCLTVQPLLIPLVNIDYYWVMACIYASEKISRQTIFHLVLMRISYDYVVTGVLAGMNFDLIAILIFLSVIGIFLALVVGRLQMQQYDELEREFENQSKQMQDLEEGYKNLSELAHAPSFGEILPMFRDKSGKLQVDRRATFTVPGTIARQVLLLVEAIEHVDAESNLSEGSLQSALNVFGLNLDDSGSKEDLQTMLRLARHCIHARILGETEDDFQARIATLKVNGSLTLSHNGRLRLREFLSALYKPDMKPLRDDFLHLFPIIESVMLEETERE